MEPTYAGQRRSTIGKSYEHASSEVVGLNCKENAPASGGWSHGNGQLSSARFVFIFILYFEGMDRLDTPNLDTHRHASTRRLSFARYVDTLTL